MIRAFGQPDLNARIDRCLETDYGTSTEVTALQINYYPNQQSPMPTDRRPTCASAFKASMIPGTKSFQNALRQPARERALGALLRSLLRLCGAYLRDLRLQRQVCEDAAVPVQRGMRAPWRLLLGLLRQVQREHG